MAAPEEIIPFDLSRMFFGDLPWLFTLEVVFRTAFIYLFALVMFRLVSRRTVGELSFIEFLLVIALGSAVGDPMFYADVPLFHALIAVVLVVLISRGVNTIINASEKLEAKLEGSPILLQQNEIIAVDGIRNARMNNEEFFANLRRAGVEHLGQVSFAFLEQSGSVTVFRAQRERAGLRIVPPWDLAKPTHYGDSPWPHNAQAIGCCNCGTIVRHMSHMGPCPNCEKNDWTDAVALPEEQLGVADGSGRSSSEHRQ